MLSSRTGLARRPGGQRRSVLAGLALLGLVASTGCQVEYAGMTLPSGKYFHDDVQYFAPGPEFPYANTQAATQRARMQAAGMPVPPMPGAGGATPMAPGSGSGPLIPRPVPASEIENERPGGPSAPGIPSPPVPETVPGGAVPAPPG